VPSVAVLAFEGFALFHNYSPKRIPAQAGISANVLLDEFLYRF
jgi:hypothetical protein